MKVTTQQVCALVWILTGLVTTAYAAETGSHRLGMTLTTDKATYASGEPIELRLEVFNRTGEAVHIEFRTGQRFDFAIVDENGDERWRWSTGRVFSQMISTETLGPETPQRTYAADFDGTLQPGSYTILGRLTSANRPMTRRMRIEVR